MDHELVPLDEEIDHLKNIGIRAVRTFLVTFASVFIAGSSIGVDKIEYGPGLTAAVIAALVSLAQGLSGIPENVGVRHSKIVAIILRALKTFFQSVVAMMGTTLIYSWEDINWVSIAAVSATGAIGSFLFGMTSVLPEEKPPATIS